jgi:23S rRNA pseudouridine1911/1915/1917 synthase
MLNRGYAYTTIINSKYHGQILLSHLASLYPHSTPQAWQQNLNNGEVTLNGVTATGSESVTSGQTLVWNRPPWIEPDAPQHFEVLLDDPYLLAVSKPSGLPTLPGAGFLETPSCAWCKSIPPTQTLSTGWAEAPAASFCLPKQRRRPRI